MTDQCKRCSLMGDIKACRATECYQHESWYAVEQQNKIDSLESSLRDMIASSERVIEAFNND